MMDPERWEIDDWEPTLEDLLAVDEWRWAMIVDRWIDGEDV